MKFRVAERWIVVGLYAVFLSWGHQFTSYERIVAFFLQKKHKTCGYESQTCTTADMAGVALHVAFSDITYLLLLVTLSLLHTCDSLWYVDVNSRVSMWGTGYPYGFVILIYL